MNLEKQLNPKIKKVAMENNFRIDKDIIVFDVETSDNVIEKANMISLGAYLFNRFGKTTNKSFHTYIKPYKSYWNPDKEQFHGLTLDFVKENGISLRRALKLFSGWCNEVSSNFYLGHWSSDFDQSILKNAYDFCNWEYPFHYRGYDIASVTRIFLSSHGIKSPSLKLCADSLKIKTDHLKEHDARDDSYMASMCLEKVIDGISNKTNFKS